MHFIAFRLKRAHYASLRIAREIAGRCGLTPARFDLLYAVWEGCGHSLSQMKLRRTLGVARSTVSRMLKSLEQLGIVRRRNNYEDRRSRNVEMTPAGRKQFLELLYMVQGWEEMHLAYEVAFGLPRGENTFGPIEDLFSSLMRVAREFRDTGDIWYPSGHPDD